MKSVQPEVFLVARPQLDYEALAAYLREVGGEDWLEQLDRGEPRQTRRTWPSSPARLCYRAWEPGLNPNVVRVRTDQDKYLENILASAHGSVLEHAMFSFVLHNISQGCDPRAGAAPAGHGDVAGVAAVRPAGRHPVLVP